VALLLLIRHALTDSTGKRLTGRQPGVGLSARGREQAAGLPDRLDGLPLAALYSSPVQRCRETAAPLARRRRLKVALRSSLSEVEYGAWTGRSLSQLRRTKRWNTVQRVPSRMRFPEGESLAEVQARVVEELERIAAAHPKGVVAVFSHADPIRLAVAHLAGAHLDQFQRVLIDPASVSAVALGDGIPRVIRVNDAGPLSGLVPPKPRRGNVRG